MSTEAIFQQVKFVSAAVLAGEAQIDLSLAATLRMAADALDAHTAVGVPAYAKQPMLDHLENALASQMASRRHIVLAHATFGKTAARLGVNAEDYGDWWPCPDFPKPPSGTENVHPIVAVA